MTYQHLFLKTRSFVGWIKNYVVELHFKEYFSYIWLLHVFAYSQRVDMLDDEESFKSTLPPPPPPPPPEMSNHTAENLFLSFTCHLPADVQRIYTTCLVTYNVL